MNYEDMPDDPLYLAWCRAEFEANCLYDELDEDFTDPRYIKANKKARKLLDIFLRQPTSSLPIILLKLEIACDCEDYYTDAANLNCTYVAPCAVVSALSDLQNMMVSNY